VASSIDNQLMKLMVHPSIAKPEDLRGKTLAVTRFGSLTDLLIRPVLKNGGLEPQKDVKLIQIGRMPDIATAIAQTSVDGGVISFPTSVQAEKMSIKTMLDFAESGFDLPATTVVVSRRYSKSNHDTVLRFLKAYIEGTRSFSQTESWESARCVGTAALTIARCWLRLTIFLRPDTSRKFPTSMQRELKTR
jgi:ABC-type nitrate/sulfonate/bicarbonate transport system substrate-binding protein